MKDRETILTENPLAEECERRGMVFTKRAGKELLALCPMHEDNSPSFRVNIEKQTFFCDPCGVGGSVIDLVMRMDGISVAEAMKKLGGASDHHLSHQNGSRGQQRSSAPINNGAEPIGKEVASYDYTDAAGNLLYQVVRYEPKTFRQRRPEKGGGWTWKLEGVRRVLYNLPKIAKADFVWIVEGEKDADALNAKGMVATTNAGGAKKWEDAYTDALKDKDVILCGDNDEPGRAHVVAVLEAIKKSARSVRVVQVPEPHKDAADLLANEPKGMVRLVELAEESEVLHKGLAVPVRSMAQLEEIYRKFATQTVRNSLDLGLWLPSFRWLVRPIVPGEVVCLIMDTGVGKTMCLQNIALNTTLPTLLFEIELPDTLTFERFAAMATKTKSSVVFDRYREHASVDWRSGSRLSHVSVCSESRLTPPDIQRIIEGAGIKTGTRPVVVMLDYVQLIRGLGKGRYESITMVAEELKIIAKETNTIMVIASQIHRKEGMEIGLHDAKDSGQLENSAGLVLGAWRDADDTDRLLLKVLKNTKGKSGHIVACRISDSLEINEEAKPERVEQAQLPINPQNGRTKRSWHQ